MAAPSDLIPVQDASDENNPKRVAASTIGAGKQTIWIPAAGLEIGDPGVTNPPEPGFLTIGTAAGSLPILAFDASSIENAAFNLAMPKGWDEGPLTAQVYWTHPETTTNFSVVWRVQLATFGNADALDLDLYSGSNIVDVGGITSDLYISPESGAINPGGEESEGDLLIGRVLRQATDGSDTLAVDAHLIGIKIFYNTNANTDD